MSGCTALTWSTADRWHPGTGRGCPWPPRPAGAAATLDATWQVWAPSHTGGTGPTDSKSAVLVGRELRGDLGPRHSGPRLTAVLQQQMQQLTRWMGSKQHPEGRAAVVVLPTALPSSHTRAHRHMSEMEACWGVPSASTRSNTSRHAKGRWTPSEKVSGRTVRRACPAMAAPLGHYGVDTVWILSDRQ